jgi:hypothetical protein
LQPGLEDAFAAAIEVVAVDEGELGWGVGGHGVAGYCMDGQYIGAGLASALLQHLKKTK